MIEKYPTLFIFAGNNGSGKSTMRNLIGEKIGIETSIDPDSLTRKYRRYNMKNPEFHAGREAINSINRYINEGKSFSMETTLSGKRAMKQIKRAKNKGFELILFFVGLDGVDLNIRRVRQRVKSGGHHIPEEDIIRREERVTKNLLSIMPLLDQIIVLDNTEGQAKMIINFRNNIDYYSIDELPSWAEIIDESIEKLMRGK